MSSKIYQSELANITAANFYSRAPEYRTKDYLAIDIDAALAEREAHVRAEEREKVKGLVEALQLMVYETTHLSPMRDDGSHNCRISKNALEQARAALATYNDNRKG
jgi:hypothetical protein